MLRKIVSIKNVGRFATYGASGDVELKRYSLIFAENGRGKTMLCALLRSRRSAYRTHVICRTTLAGLGAPDAEIPTTGGMITFGQGSRCSTVPIIAIYDS